MKVRGITYTFNKAAILIHKIGGSGMTPEIKNLKKAIAKRVTDARAALGSEILTKTSTHNPSHGA
ncbi:MAG: hypothetical protein KAS59_02510 [Alphaproteobacteria bacterium]|nr:hypothetical protein [Alphaproteobacteria bacterium]MCK5556094.1 hypothetical protein [Alphaproteobacteria bacterium]